MRSMRMSNGAIPGSVPGPGAFLLMLLASLPILACDRDPTAPSQETGEWRGGVAAGHEIEIKGLSGPVLATHSSGDEVVVHWKKEGRKSDPAGVEIQVIEHDGDVTVCALYPDVPGQAPNECLPGEQGHMSSRDNDVQVAFTVQVPTGVRFTGRTVSGDIGAVGLRGDVLATAVSGNLELSSMGRVEGTAVSGRIRAFIGSGDWGRDLQFLTVSGDIDVTVPASTNAIVTANTVSGTITSDFPLSGTGTSKQGILGGGGPTLTLAVVSGDIRLRAGN